jgi:hypothetical protein
MSWESCSELRCDSISIATIHDEKGKDLIPLGMMDGTLPERNDQGTVPYLGRRRALAERLVQDLVVSRFCHDFTLKFERASLSLLTFLMKDRASQMRIERRNQPEKCTEGHYI